MATLFRRAGPPLIDDPNIPEFFVETVAIVQRLLGGNARMTYCVSKTDRRGRTLWVPVVQLVRPIALMSEGLRREYAEILEGSTPLDVQAKPPRLN